MFDPTSRCDHFHPDDETLFVSDLNIFEYDEFRRQLEERIDMKPYYQRHCLSRPHFITGELMYGPHWWLETAIERQIRASLREQSPGNWESTEEGTAIVLTDSGEQISYSTRLTYAQLQHIEQKVEEWLDINT